MTRLLRRLRYWMQRGKMDAELAEEMEFHRTMLAQSGEAPSTMGNTTLAREDARSVWIGPWLESLWQDVAYGSRSLLRQPAFTLTALFALGSAIGLNTTLFTIFDAVALRPWSVRDPARVVNINIVTPEGSGGLGVAESRYLAQHAQTLDGVITMRNGETVKLDNIARHLTYVSGNYFQVLGIGMERGRGFLETEDRPLGPANVIVISHDLWENRFSADSSVIGSSIRLDDVPFTIVGVTPAEFTGTNPLRNDIWMPLSTRKLLRPNDTSVQDWLTSPRFCCAPVAARIARGVSRVRAQAEVALLLDQFQTANHLAPQRGAVVLSGTTWMETPAKKRQIIPTIATLFLAVTLVLLLACANVGNLLLARATARRREIAVRLSLGGGRNRIVRQLLVESLLLASLASALGLIAAMIATPVVLRQVAIDQAFRPGFDINVFVYTIAVGILSCLAFGLAPALHGARENISAALKSGPDISGSARLPLRSVLLAVQVAVSVILLANAGFLVRAMQRAQSINPGFDIQNVTVLTIDLPASEYTGPRSIRLTRDLLTEIEQAKDLPQTALTLNPPLSNSTYSTSFRPNPRDTKTMHIYYNEISSRYAGALGMRMLAGRNFVDDDDSRDVLMINKAAAKRWWPGENAVGKTVLTGNKLRQVVGIISDTYTNDLSSVEAVLYLPITGHWGAPFILVHDRSAAAINRVEAIVKRIEPRAQVRAEPLAVNFQRQLQPSIYISEIAGLLGLLALVIASVGMSGVFAYVVGQRTREIGVRIALGAGPAQIVQLVLNSSVRALAWGASIGISGAAAISMLLAHAVPGVRPLDPPAYFGVALVLGAAVALASAVPARRATQIDPVRALRWE